MNLSEIQKQLQEQDLDGWLLYDYEGSNPFARRILKISTEAVITRRFFYLIPKKGTPTKITHQIESNCLDHLPGKKVLYLSWEQLEKKLSESLKGCRKVAMEYFPHNRIPNVSKVDAGTVDLVRDNGVEVVSSAELLQYLTHLEDDQIESHFAAAAILKKTLSNAWDLISDNLRKDKIITEFDVQQFILSEFAAYDCITEDGPICAVNENSALPHYVAFHGKAKGIEKGDFILIDLWCKKNSANAVYADITHVGIAASEPTPRHQEIFEIVRQAQLLTTTFMQERLKKHFPLHGWEVDQFCRQFIEKKGYGNFFQHRTGHSIDTNVHGSGVNLDNLETRDTRLIMPRCCFSVEPGIYIPDEFGVRLEYDVLIDPSFEVQVSGDVQESIFCLL